MHCESPKVDLRQSKVSGVRNVIRGNGVLVPTSLSGLPSYVLRSRTSLLFTYFVVFFLSSDIPFPPLTSPKRPSWGFRIVFTVTDL